MLSPGCGTEAPGPAAAGRGGDGGGGTGGIAGSGGVSGSSGTSGSGGTGQGGGMDAGGSAPSLTAELLYTADADVSGWSELLLDSTDVYVAAAEDEGGNSSDGHIYRVSRSGGGARIASNVGVVFTMALTTEWIVVTVDEEPFRDTSGGKLLVISKATGAVRELGTANTPGGVVADGNEAYWTASYATTSGLQARTRKVSLSDGMISETDVVGVQAFDANWIYGIDQNLTIYRRDRKLAAPAEPLGTAQKQGRILLELESIYRIESPSSRDEGTLFRQRFSGAAATFALGTGFHAEPVVSGTDLYWRTYKSEFSMLSGRYETIELGLHRFDAKAETIIPLGTPAIPVHLIAAEMPNVLLVTSGKPFKLLRLTSR
jgi:hypothetical protein